MPEQKRDKPESKWQGPTSMSKGFLAFFDILGFKNGVMGFDCMRYVQNYLDILKRIIEPIQSQHKDEVHILAVSDSIIVTTIGRTQPVDFFQICSELFFELVASGVPVRGAISHGMYKREAVAGGRGNVFIAGPALVEAYELEKNQEWVGIAVAPSTHTALFDFFNNWSWTPPQSQLATYFQFIENLPIKAGKEKSIDLASFVLYPRRSQDSEYVDKKFVESLKRMIFGTIDPCIRQKYDSTLKFIERIHDQSGEYHGPVDMPGIDTVKKKIASYDGVGIAPDAIQNWYRKIVAENVPAVDIVADIEAKLSDFQGKQVIDRANELM